MSIIPLLAELFESSVTIEPYTGEGQHGVESYGAGVAYDCHITGRSRLIKDFSGQERVSTVQVVIAGSPGVGEKDRITLPSPYNPAQPPIMFVKRLRDENGPHHEVVYC